MTTELETVVMRQCDECGGDRYILHGCCSGRECGCRGLPVLMANCAKCNPMGDADIPDSMKEISEHVEYRFVAA